MRGPLVAMDTEFAHTFSNRENILSVIMSCLRSSPNFRMSRVGVCCSAVESMFDISSHCGFCGSKGFRLTRSCGVLRVVHLSLSNYVIVLFYLFR